VLLISCFLTVGCYLNCSNYPSHNVNLASFVSCYKLSRHNGLLACFSSPIAWICLTFSANCLVLEGYLIAWSVFLHTHYHVFGFCQVFPLWWINWIVHLWLLLVLLLCKIRYVRLHANLIFLWLHGLRLLWFLPHAWLHWFPCFLIFCPPHLPFNQVRIASDMVFIMSNE
jgi:hypothetical protein